jgi:hypothetical protein
VLVKLSLAVFNSDTSVHEDPFHVSESATVAIV